MKVRITESMAGPTVSYSRGQVTDLPDKEAMSLIAAGLAEGLTPAQSTETRESKTPVNKRRK